jgi:hypothetical protein
MRQLRDRLLFMSVVCQLVWLCYGVCSTHLYRFKSMLSDSESRLDYRKSSIDGIPETLDYVLSLCYFVATLFTTSCALNTGVGHKRLL